MSIALVRFGCILLLTTPSAVVLSVCTGVFGCGCPISINIFLIGTASLVFMYNVPNLASAADYITALMM